MSNAMTLSEFLATRTGLEFTPEQLAAIADFQTNEKFSSVVGTIKKWRDADDRSDTLNSEGETLTPAEFLSQVWELSETLTAMVLPNTDLSRGKVQTMIGFELDGRSVQVRVYETPETA